MKVGIYTFQIAGKDTEANCKCRSLSGRRFRRQLPRLSTRSYEELRRGDGSPYCEVEGAKGPRREEMREREREQQTMNEYHPT